MGVEGIPAGDAFAGHVAESYWFTDDKPRDNCGVFAVISDSIDVAQAAAVAGIEQQHRGQEAAGISVGNNIEMRSATGLGLMTEVFRDKNSLPQLDGAHTASSHVRYSTFDTDRALEAAQPMMGRVDTMPFSFATNGNVTNVPEIRAKYPDEDLEVASDSELLVRDIERTHVEGRPLEDTVIEAAQSWKGAFSIVIVTPDRIIGARDRNGFRPLFLSAVDGGYAFSSETSATRMPFFKGSDRGEVAPGQMVSIDRNGIRRRWMFDTGDVNPTLCSFESIYLSSPIAEINGRPVESLRSMMGEMLAKRDLAEAGGRAIADIVIGVPQSGLPAAEGYAEEMNKAPGINIQSVTGFMKNSYIGRTFIEAGGRSDKVMQKLATLNHKVKDKRVVLIDDSIVRGTTTKTIVAALKDAGALEVHLRSASPAIIDPCFFGIDTPDKNDLLAGTRSNDEMAKYLNVESLRFLDIDVLRSILRAREYGQCFACMTGDYPDGSLPETPIEIAQR